MKKHFGSLMKGMPHLVSCGAFLTLFSFSVQAQKAGLELKDGRSIEIIISAHSDKTLFTNSGNYKMAEILKAHFQVKQPMDERFYGFLKANSVDVDFSYMGDFNKASLIRTQQGEGLSRDSLRVVTVKFLHVIVELLDGRQLRGSFFKASHDSLVMIDKNQITVGCKASSIRSIRMHKKGSGGDAAFVGVGAGILLGLAAGSMQPPTKGFLSFSTGDKMAFFAIFFGIIGAPIGAVIGSSNKTYNINDQQEQFDLFVKKLYKK